MESEGLLLCPQEPATGPYPEPDEYTLQYLILFNIHYNIILPSTMRSSECIFPSCSSAELLNITIETIKILLTVPYSLVLSFQQGLRFTYRWL
jgi:hypothetical protein